MGWNNSEKKRHFELNTDELRTSGKKGKALHCYAITSKQLSPIIIIYGSSTVKTRKNQNNEG